MGRIFKLILDRSRPEQDVVCESQVGKSIDSLKDQLKLIDKNIEDHFRKDKKDHHDYDEII